MYKVKLNGLEKDAIRRGNFELLMEKLKESDENVIRDLKVNRDNMPFLQGASHVIDRLIEILSVPR